MIDRKQVCANCRYFCQEVDPENRPYFDEKSGECRRKPPHSNFAWFRTRAYHWCGEWEVQGDKAQQWQRLSAHPKSDHPVLLYRRGGLCKNSGMVVAYWNAAFNKWHDDADRIFEYGEFINWMDLPDTPEF